MALTPKIKAMLGTANCERLRIIRRCLSDIRQTFDRRHNSALAPAKRLGHPVSLQLLRSALAEAGIGNGDLVLVHSSASTLGRAGCLEDLDTPANPIEYAESIIDVLRECVGPTGTILMPTEGAGEPLERAYKQIIFEPATTPSNRGLITELFRRRVGTIRSVHPWYNIAAQGPLAAELLDEHHRSTPYSMDQYSPWHKLTQRGGKVIMLGCELDCNSLIHLPEYRHPAEFRRPIYFDKPIDLCYRDRIGTVQAIPVMIHVPNWASTDIVRFCAYLQGKYGLYQRVPMGSTALTTFSALHQYEALCEELARGICWYDVRYWSNP